MPGSGWMRRVSKNMVPPFLYPRNVMARSVLRHTRGIVHSGPFRGMSHVEESPNREFGAYFPKLLGTYEQELHPVVERVCELAPTRVIDIGAADGYYAVGFAWRLPHAEVIAYESDDDRRAALVSAAARNGVGARVTARGACSPTELAGDLDGENPTFVWCDVEGYEDVLFDPAKLPGLARCWLLVEVHEFAAPGVAARLQERFAATHRITTIWQTDRTRADYPFPSWYTRLLPAAYAIYLVNEFRPERMRWLWMEPNTAEGL